MNPINESDLDLLADYAAGVLDGTEADQLAHLIATDPAWSTAYHRLLDALPRASAALATLGATSDGDHGGATGDSASGGDRAGGGYGAEGVAEGDGERMPADVAARLDRALAALSGGKDPAAVSAGESGAGDKIDPLTEVASAEPDGARPVPAQADRGRRTRRMVTGPAQNRPGSRPESAPDGRVGNDDRRPGGARRRPARRAAWAGGLFAVVAAVVGLLLAQHPWSADQSRPGADAVAGPQPSADLVVTSSNFDYSHQTLVRATAMDASGAGSGGPPQAAAAPDSALRGALTRLASPAQREDCLAAVTAAVGGTPTRVDYARYAGSPAMIIVLSGARYRVVAVGPDCGLPGAGIAEIDHLA